MHAHIHIYGIYVNIYLIYLITHTHTHLLREGTSTVLFCESILILTFPYAHLMGKHSFSLALRTVLFLSWTMTGKNSIGPIF